MSCPRKRLCERRSGQSRHLCSSEPECQVDGAELICRRLRFVFVRANVMRERKAERIEGNRRTQHQIADKVHFDDTAAAFETIAVQEKVTGNSTPFNASENVGTEARCRLEIVRARKAGGNSHGSIVLGQIE